MLVVAAALAVIALLALVVGRRWLVLGDLRSDVDPFRSRVPFGRWAHPVLALALVGVFFAGGVTAVLDDPLIGIGQGVVLVGVLALVLRAEDRARGDQPDQRPVPPSKPS